MRPLALGVFLAALSTASTVPAAIDEPLRATLLQMGRDDQESIRIVTIDPSRQPTEAESKQALELNTRNRDLIRKIVREHGWPGVSLVGQDGSSAAWLVVQHMDTDLEFQQSCLALMQEAFLKGEVLPINLAYLTDRVLTHQGKQQMYGTQSLGVMSAEDEARVDRNRAAIGLGPWRDAVEKRKKVYEHGYGGGAAKDP
jgi:hypothetical protein